MLQVFRKILAVPCLILGLPAVPGCIALLGQGFSAAASATQPVFSWRIDRLVMITALPFLPFLWLGGWLWFGRATP